MVLRWQISYDKFKLKYNFINFKNSNNLNIDSNYCIYFISMVVRESKFKSKEYI